MADLCLCAEDNIPALLPSLLPPLTNILKSTAQDPTPCLSLTIKLLSPLSFARTLAIADPPSLVAALASPLPGANLLALAILHKAARAPADAAILSTLHDVVEALVRTWLAAEDTGVAEKAAKVLGDLLETDCDVGAPADHNGQVNGLPNGASQQLVRHRRPPGHAVLWRLILAERAYLSLILSYCSPSADHTERQVSLSQGRLLRLLPRLAALNMRAVSRTQHPELFPLSNAHAGLVDPALLSWAALAMVDRSDVLMHLSLVDFFEALVSILRIAETRSADVDTELSRLIKVAVQGDPELREALRTLPDRTIEEEAEPLRDYIRDLLA
jgi:hypothetical protein